MSKSSKEKTDEDKGLILEALRNNAYRSVTEIADKLGFSRQKIGRIIKDLENDNIIWGYTTVTNFNKQDLKYFIILAKRSNKPMDKQIIDASNSKMKYCTFNMATPKQMCFLCQELYEAYLFDDELWETLPKELRNKYLCEECFKKQSQQKDASKELKK